MNLGWWRAACWLTFSSTSSPSSRYIYIRPSNVATRSVSKCNCRLPLFRSSREFCKGSVKTVTASHRAAAAAGTGQG
ncbi:hypothetical protein B0H66DRAFT_562306 [Apodospora peruviana]|uniref:Uncharacterized protein n=1 Tax=Apodospora peruviana TaxID=516989 RepID=A0AAE0I241_9PEZI|nr:hypothetical protein B0H66DRAFT_562306 [Apodospora peruviana]